MTEVRRARATSRRRRASASPPTSGFAQSIDEQVKQLDESAQRLGLKPKAR
jgi:hypothetical protein